MTGVEIRERAVLAYAARFRRVVFAAGAPS